MFEAPRRSVTSVSLCKSKKFFALMGQDMIYKTAQGGALIKSNVFVFVSRDF